MIYGHLNKVIKVFKRKKIMPNIYFLLVCLDLLKQERTCSTRIMTKSHLHKILIPKPPDRGGRTNDLQAPPPEMPSFMKRRNTEKPQYQRPRGTF